MKVLWLHSTWVNHRHEGWNSHEWLLVHLSLRISVVSSSSGWLLSVRGWKSTWEHAHHSRTTHARSHHREFILISISKLILSLWLSLRSIAAWVSSRSCCIGCSALVHELLLVHCHLLCEHCLVLLIHLLMEDHLLNNGLLLLVHQELLLISVGSVCLVALVWHWHLGHAHHHRRIGTHHAHVRVGHEHVLLGCCCSLCLLLLRGSLSLVFSSLVSQLFRLLLRLFHSMSLKLFGFSFFFCSLDCRFSLCGELLLLVSSILVISSISLSLAVPLFLLVSMLFLSLFLLLLLSLEFCDGRLGK